MTLPRTLGFWRVSLAGVGVILGAGVYALIGPAAAQAGSAMWLAFVVAGVTAGLTAYSYARFAALRPRNSPEFQYAAMAFGPTTGFVGRWLMLVADLLAGATVALGSGGYLAHLAGTPVILNAPAHGCRRAARGDAPVRVAAPPYRGARAGHRGRPGVRGRRSRSAHTAAIELAQLPHARP